MSKYSKKEIKREAGDKTKGFTLQKQRAIALFFDEIKNNANTHVNVAIEYKGDVYLQNEENIFIEEQKNYDEETAFTFHSKQIINTLAYFLEIWLREQKSDSLKFGFYTTNKIGKESNSSKTQKLEIVLPDKGILELLVSKNYSNELLESIKKYLIDEYSEQYKKDITADLEDLSTDLKYTLLKKFLDSINWYFEQKNEKDYEKEVITKINNSEFGKTLTLIQTNFVYAALMLALEKKQDERDYKIKFLNKVDVENCFLRISQGQKIAIEAYKYIIFDLKEIKKKTQSYVETYVRDKYFAITQHSNLPKLVDRNVAYHNSELKIDADNLQSERGLSRKIAEIIEAPIESFINSLLPIFLFGDLGSGKSTIVSSFVANSFITDENFFGIFIPTSYLFGKVTNNLGSFISSINDFVNQELLLDEKNFDFETILYTHQETTLIIDGLDELETSEALYVISHLKNLANSKPHLKIITSGRPLELKGLINFNEWTCLTVLPLLEEEIKLILRNEAFAVGLSQEEVESDVNQRMDVLNSRPELLTIANTPLTICLIRDYLDTSLKDKSLGEIIYDVVKTRLNWVEKDKKTYNCDKFIRAHKHVAQRELLLGKIAIKIQNTKDKVISEDALFELLNGEIIEQTVDRNEIINQATIFFKSNFLQKTSNDKLAFASKPLFQLALGIELYEKIKNKNIDICDYYNLWRELSFAATISRVKDKFDGHRVFYKSLLDAILFTEENTPAAAVICAEFQDEKLSEYFIEKLKSLSFRPIRNWGLKEFIAPYAFAYCFYNSKTGFNWLFDNYINPKYPSHTGEDELVATILRHYFHLKNYNISNEEEAKLKSLIPYHIKFQTFDCNSLLPTFCLVIPNAFNSEQKSRLLAESLKHSLVQKKAKLLLLEESIKGDKEYENVIQALEIVNREGRGDKKAVELWFEINNKKSISENILATAIKFIATTDSSDLYDKLKEKLGEDNLLSYLRFCALESVNHSDYAALILHEKLKEINIHLVVLPLMMNSDWSDKNLKKEQILYSFIDEYGSKAIDIIVKNLPIRDRLGIPELYWKIFLYALKKSEHIYIDEFLNSVRNLNNYTLPRYAHVRDGLKKLIEAKPDYKYCLYDGLNSMDYKLRYHTAQILVLCFPETEVRGIEILMSSTFESLGKDKEWIRFTFKLNFGKDVIRHIRKIKDELVPVGRIYALMLLYHNKQSLTNEDQIELIEGILNKGYFYDVSASFEDDGINRVACDPEFREKIFEYFKSDHCVLAKKAATIIYYQYFNELSLSEKARCWSLMIDDFDYQMKEFLTKHLDLLKEKEFIEEIENLKIINKKISLFYLIYQTIEKNENWEELILQILHGRNGHFDSHSISWFFHALIDISKNKKERFDKIGEAVVKIMKLPSIYEAKHYNNIFPYLALMAHEFKTIEPEDLGKIIIEYEIMEEIACALAIRHGSIPQNYYSSKNKGYITLFNQYVNSDFQLPDSDNIMMCLVDSEYIPNKFNDILKASLIYGLINDDELEDLSKKGNLSTYLAIVVSFCRNRSSLLNSVIRARDIGSYKYNSRDNTDYHKSLLERIKEISIIDENNKENFTKSIIQALSETNDENEIVNLFKELFTLDVKIDIQLLPKFFESLLDRAYLMDLNLAYQLSIFFAKKLKEADKEFIQIEIHKYLKPLLNSDSESKEYENKYQLIAWVFSLAIFYIKDDTTDYSERGFLEGLRNIFVQDGQNFTSANKSDIKFKGLDLFNYTFPLYQKVNPLVLKKAIERGLTSNNPEIYSVCRLIMSMTNNKQ